MPLAYRRLSLWAPSIMKFLALLGHEEDKDGQDVPLRTALLRTWDRSVSESRLGYCAMENEECSFQQKTSTVYSICQTMQQQKCLHEQDWHFARWLSTQGSLPTCLRSYEQTPRSGKHSLNENSSESLVHRLLLMNPFF